MGFPASITFYQLAQIRKFAEERGHNPDDIRIETATWNDQWDALLHGKARVDPESARLLCWIGIGDVSYLALVDDPASRSINKQSLVLDLISALPCCGNGF